MDYAERVCVVDWVGYCDSDSAREVMGEAAVEEEARFEASGVHKKFGRCVYRCWFLCVYVVVGVAAVEEEARF